MIECNQEKVGELASMVREMDGLVKERDFLRIELNANSKFDTFGVLEKFPLGIVYVNDRKIVFSNLEMRKLCNSLLIGMKIEDLFLKKGSILDNLLSFDVLKKVSVKAFTQKPYSDHFLADVYIHREENYQSEKVIVFCFVKKT